jgi:hypothetical protein
MSYIEMLLKELEVCPVIGQSYGEHREIDICDRNTYILVYGPGKKQITGG